MINYLIITSKVYVDILQQSGLVSLCNVTPIRDRRWDRYPPPSDGCKVSHLGDLQHCTNGEKTNSLGLKIAVWRWIGTSCTAPLHCNAWRVTKTLNWHSFIQSLFKQDLSIFMRKTWTNGSVKIRCHIVTSKHTSFICNTTKQDPRNTRKIKLYLRSSF